MNNYQYTEFPISFKISFNKLLEHYEKLVGHDDKFTADKAQRILKIADDNPILKSGFSDASFLEIYQEEIGILLQDSFSAILTNNEIKAASIPFQDTIFNLSERFKVIIKDAGEGFVLTIKNMPEDDLYILACNLILNFCYGYHINFKRPFYYEIPDKMGIMRYYKILHNADFFEIIPTERAMPITQEDYDELLDNFNNIELWKEKFPLESYIFKGFVMSNIFDITDDQSISNIKSALISEGNHKADEFFMNNFHEIFQSFLGIKDLKVGFSAYNKEDDCFGSVYKSGVTSFLLNNTEVNNCHALLCKDSYKRLLVDNTFYTVSDVDKYLERSKGKAPQLKTFKQQGIKSAILAPITDNDELLGVLEIVSNKPKLLNSINATKLMDVMPFIVASVLRSKKEEENLIEAVIQQECTSIHPSVHWKFAIEARNFIKQQYQGANPSFNKIAFSDIYPLYGQIDIKGSSEARNSATKEDLSIQLNLLNSILEEALKVENLTIYKQYIFQINTYLNRLQNQFQADSEQQISNFLKNDTKLVLEHVVTLDNLKQVLEPYYDEIDNELNIVYHNRKKYDDTISKINKEMALLLDVKQEEAQEMYPHYFERYKTDGVEHNMYIGESITKEVSFNPIYLYNLRLWQLQVMCEMENTYYQMQADLPIQLDVASMILVFNQPLSISFRMDEKQFDVDGTYNARYEVVKKRVDKANIKGTEERVTKKGTMSIIYSQKEDEIEYLKYVRFMQSKNMFDYDVEILELQDLQGVTGLKAIRVSIIYQKNKEDDKTFYTYDDLIKEIKA